MHRGAEPLNGSVPKRPQPGQTEAVGALGCTVRAGDQHSNSTIEPTLVVPKDNVLGRMFNFVFARRDISMHEEREARK